MFFFGIASNIIALVIFSIFSLSMLYYSVQEKAAEKIDSILHKNQNHSTSIEKSSINYNDVSTKVQTVGNDFPNCNFSLANYPLLNIVKIPIPYNKLLLNGYFYVIHSRGPPC